MNADAAVIAALQAAHDLEATASEKWHKQEHQWKNGETKYPKLGKYFDRRHKEAYQRQHDLRKHMMRLGATVDTTLGDTGYTDDVKEAFTDACGLLDKLSEAHEAVRVAAKEAGDRDTIEAFHGVTHDLRKIYKHGEQKLRQVDDLGVPMFLSQQL
jgi:hypothetical protein